jgi:hypothetical protein
MLPILSETRQKPTYSTKAIQKAIEKVHALELKAVRFRTLLGAQTGRAKK